MRLNKVTVSCGHEIDTQVLVGGTQEREISRQNLRH